MGVCSASIYDSCIPEKFITRSRSGAGENLHLQGRSPVTRGRRTAACAARRAALRGPAVAPIRLDGAVAEISALRLATADVRLAACGLASGGPKRGRCLALASGPQPLLQCLRALAASPPAAGGSVATREAPCPTRPRTATEAGAGPVEHEAHVEVGAELGVIADVVEDQLPAQEQLRGQLPHGRAGDVEAGGQRVAIGFQRVHIHAQVQLAVGRCRRRCGRPGEGRSGWRAAKHAVVERGRQAHAVAGHPRPSRARRGRRRRRRRTAGGC